MHASHFQENTGFQPAVMINRYHRNQPDQHEQIRDAVRAWAAAEDNQDVVAGLIIEEWERQGGTGLDFPADLSRRRQKLFRWFDGDTGLPPLSVEVTEQGIKIIDGQHRFIGAKLAIAMGHDIPRIECRDFVGTELDKLAHMAKSSQGKPITPLQRAGAYNRARNQGHTSAEIARAFGRSVADVETHLQLLSSGDVLIGMVESGEVAATTAIALSREDNILSPSSLRRQWDRLTTRRQNGHSGSKSTGQPIDWNNTDWIDGVLDENSF